MFDNLTRRELIAMAVHQKEAISILSKENANLKALIPVEKSEPIIQDTTSEKRVVICKNSAIGVSKIDFNEISASPGFRKLESSNLFDSVGCDIFGTAVVRGADEKNENSEDTEIDWSGTIVETKSGEEFKAFVDSLPEDTGTHYRFSYIVPVTSADFARGTITINLDPFRIAAIYGMKSFAAQTILKKVLCTGNRGHNSTKEDIDDIICACRRWLQMLEEDALLEQRISPPQKGQSQP